MKKNKITHISIIIAGIIFILIPVFHTNLWFDESYSVAIANKNFEEIWTIGGNDVHPVLYYYFLHIINLVFGSKIILYRLFSVMCMALLGIIGFTHIRKDFGEKTGLLFSLLVFFFPANIVYAGEIRMYSMAMLLVTLMSIYAYRIYKNKDQNYIKNWILFAIFSLSSAYTHYYGLMIAGIENLILFIAFILQAKKEKKFVCNLKAFIISAISQIVLYLPWVISLLKQVKQVSGGFWIQIHFPETLIEFFMFPFTGNLGTTSYIEFPLAILFGILICVYMIYIHNKNKKDEFLKNAKIAIILWITVAIAACIVSIIIQRPIIYARYMLCVQGLFIFFIACTMAKKGTEKGNIVIITTSIVLSILGACILSQENYGRINKEFQKYISENIKDGDILVCVNEQSGFTISSYFPNNKLYFIDEYKWNVAEAYKAYGETVYDLNFLEEYKGRIWIINTSNYNTYEKINKKYNVKLIDQKAFNVEYKNCQYTLTLVEK